MEIKAIEYILAVAEGLTFLEASELFHISLSSFSKSIKRLETELGIEVFDRSARKAKLSDEGKKALKHFEKIVAEYDSLMNISEKSSCNVLVLPYNTMNFRMLLSEYEEQYHTTINAVKAFYTSDFMSKAVLRQVDLMITHESILKGDHWAHHKLNKNRLLLLISKHHSLANKKYVFLDDIKTENVMIREGTKIILDHFIKDIDTFNFTICEQSRERMIGDIASRKAIGIFYESDIEIFNFQRAEIVVRYIEDVPDDPFIIAWPKHKLLTSIEKQLVQFIVDQSQ